MPSSETTRTLPGSSTADTGQPGEPSPAAIARQQLAEQEVTGRAPMAGYDRDAVGPAWSDDVTVAGGRNGRDTRNDVLRRDLANVSGNLLAVDSGLNRGKGAGDAATWLPSNRSFRCEHVSTPIRVKHNWGLWVTPPEADAMSRELDRCSV